MYGWRARIGLIVPSTNSTIEVEFHRLVPEGVSVHTARMYLEWAQDEDTHNAHVIMNEDAMRAARALATVNPNVIVYGCTGGSFFEGPDYHKALADELFHVSKVRVVTTSTAVLVALNTLGIRKVAVATPYPDALNEAEEEFLVNNGYEVKNLKGLGLLTTGTGMGPRRLGTTYPGDVYRHAIATDVPDSEGIFISCTDFRALDVVDKLEKDTGKPVITSNQVTIWHTLRTLGIRDPIKGFGRLLEQY
jgi:maleate isomerase